MSLHVIIGFSSHSADAEASLVYAGRSAEAGRLAKAADTAHVVFEEFHNVQGLRKNNPNFKDTVITEEVPVEVTEEVPVEVTEEVPAKRGKK